MSRMISHQALSQGRRFRMISLKVAARCRCAVLEDTYEDVVVTADMQWRREQAWMHLEEAWRMQQALEEDGPEAGEKDIHLAGDGSLYG